MLHFVHPVSIMGWPCFLRS